MNIAFDATHHFGFSGINVYMRNLVGSLARFFPDDCYTMLTTYNKIERLRSEFPEADRVLLNADNPFPNSLALGSLGRPIMDRFYGRIYEKQSHKYDIIHFTNPYHFESIRNAVVTLHDMMPYYPGMGFNRSQRRNFRKKIRAIERSNAYIFVPSEYVRTELLSHYDFTPERMCVTHEAAGSDFVPIPSGSNDLSAFGLKAEDEFFLYVGRIDARKNIERLVQAYLDLDSDITERIKLVLIANGPDLHRERFREQYLRHKNIIHLSSVPNYDLARLLSRALALAFVSLSEGFGIPILEAMQCGCPVLTSNVSSMPEVAGDAAVYVDPYDVTTIREGLRKLAEEDALRETLRAAGFRRAADFSWYECAQKTHAGYEAAYGRL